MQHLELQVKEYKEFLQRKDNKKEGLIKNSCIELGKLKFIVDAVFDKLKRNVVTGELFLKEITKHHGKLDTFNFIKGNFLQVCFFFFWGGSNSLFFFGEGGGGC